MILDAALEVFSKYGYESTDVDWIAKQAGIGKGTIYRHFLSKTELFLATVDRGFEGLREKMGELAFIKAPFEEKLRMGLNLYVDFFVDNPQYYRIMMIEQPHRRLKLAPRVIRGHQRFASHLVNAIRSGIASGELKSVDSEFAALSLMAIAAVIIEKRLYGRKDSSKKDVYSAIDLFLRGVKK